MSVSLTFCPKALRSLDQYLGKSDKPCAYHFGPDTVGTFERLLKTFERLLRDF